MKHDFLKSADEPCYVLFLAAPLSGLWAFFAYVPDTAPFHERMLYMAGGAQLLAMLGGEARMPWQAKVRQPLPHVVTSHVVAPLVCLCAARKTTLATASSPTLHTGSSPSSLPPRQKRPRMFVSRTTSPCNLHTISIQSPYNLHTISVQSTVDLSR